MTASVYRIPVSVYLLKNDSSQIKISTASTQAVSKANLNASVITYNDGVKINFDTSSFVLNTKTWTIDKGGELSFRSNTTASGEVVLHESNQLSKIKNRSFQMRAVGTTCWSILPM